MKKADLFFNGVRLPVDFIMLVAAGIVTYLLRTHLLDAYWPVLFGFNLPLGRYLALVAGVAVLFVAAYAVSGLYSMRVRMGLAEELAKIIIASSAALMAVIVTIFVRQELFNSRFLVLGTWLTAMLFVFIGRILVRAVQTYAVARHEFGIHRLMVIGNDDASLRISQSVIQDPSSGYRLVKHLMRPDVDEVFRAVGNPGVDEIILASHDYPSDDVMRLADFCGEHHIVFKFIPNLYQALTTRVEVDVINGLPLIEVKRTPLDGWGRIAKRAFDVVFASLGLIILSPLFAVIAFAIKWETEGPVFVRLKRVSRNKEFDLLKFRSMIDNAHEYNLYLRSLANDRPEAGPLWKMRDDPRITRVGRFIRKYRLDELAQFWNVLKGDMSLVGPRPHQPDEIARYARHHKKVLAIKAGATGFAQASGSSDLPFEEEVTLDTFYIENWSLWLDIKITAKTALNMLRDRSAV